MEAQSINVQPSRGLEPDYPISSPAQMADYQRTLTEASIAQLQQEMASTSEAVNYLEDALTSARSRQDYLQGAIDRINAPAKAMPGASIR